MRTRLLVFGVGFVKSIEVYYLIVHLRIAEQKAAEEDGKE